MTLTLLESLDTGSPEALNATINRVRAIGLVYDLVDAAEDLNSIVLEDYIERLVWHLQMSYGDIPVSIAYDTSTDRHYAKLEPTISLGLLLHELVAIVVPHARHCGSCVLHIRQSASDSKIDYDINCQTSNMDNEAVIEQLKSPTGLAVALTERLQITLDRGSEDSVLRVSLPKAVIVKSVVMPCEQPQG